MPQYWLRLYSHGGYHTWVYLFETDIWNNISLTVYHGKAKHDDIDMSPDFSRLIQCTGNHFHVRGWFRPDQSFYPGLAAIGIG